MTILREEYGVAAGSADMVRCFQPALTKLMGRISDEVLANAKLKAKEWNQMGAEPEAQSRYVSDHGGASWLLIQQQVRPERSTKGCKTVCRGDVEEGRHSNGDFVWIQG